ncbi:MAG TPA: hypothetical protein VGL66_11580 [Caulobacteraceae bacterium]
MKPYGGEEVDGGGGGEPPSGDDVRIAKLEAHVGHIQSALGDIKTELRALVGALSHLPTKQDLFVNITIIVTIGLAVIAIVIGGIIGGLALLKPDEKPAVIEKTAQSTAAPPPQIYLVPITPAQTAPVTH